MDIRMKYFPHQSGNNNEQVAAMNAALVTELEMDAMPASMIATKNRTCEFLIEKAKLRNFNPTTYMGRLGLNSTKSIQLFNSEQAC